MERDDGYFRNKVRAVQTWFPKGKMVVGILGSSTFYDPFSPSICRYLGEALTKSRAVLLTTHRHGIAEMVTWSFIHFGGKEAKKNAFHLVSRENKTAGDVVENSYSGFVLTGGACEEEQDALFPMIAPVYILIEGGPRSAMMARAALQQGAVVIPVSRTGGAACGHFGAPYCPKPSCVPLMDWVALQDPWAEVPDVVSHIVRIVQAVYRSAV